MKTTEDELDGQLKNQFDRLRPVKPLNPQAVAEERAKFLAQGEQFRSLPVSEQLKPRHNGWINTIGLAFQRKERIPMLNILLVVVMAIGFVFGGAGITVYAAQDSLPDEALYGVKTWSEDTRLSWANSAQERLELTLGFTQRRVLEIGELQAAGKTVTAGVITRLHEELNTALQLAAGMDEPQMVQALEQIRLQAATQSQTIATLASAAAGGSDEDLEKLQERLREQAQMASTGQADPQGFRQQVRDRDRTSQPTLAPTEATALDAGEETPTGKPGQGGNGNGQGGQASKTPGQGAGEPNPGVTPQPTGGSYGPGEQPSTTPGGYGPGEPNPSHTPQPTGGSYGPGAGNGQPSETPGGGYGPGEPNPSATSQPTGGSYGPGPGNGQPSETPGGGYGPGEPNPSATPQPTGGSYGPGEQPSTTPGGYGPGPQNGTATCTPAQNGEGGSGYGPQPTPQPTGSKP